MYIFSHIDIKKTFSVISIFFEENLKSQCQYFYMERKLLPILILNMYIWTFTEILISMHIPVYQILLVINRYDLRRPSLDDLAFGFSSVLLRQFELHQPTRLHRSVGEEGKKRSWFWREKIRINMRMAGMMMLAWCWLVNMGPRAKSEGDTSYFYTFRPHMAVGAKKHT